MSDSRNNNLEGENLEAGYRQQTYAQDKAYARILILMVIMGIAGFSIVDYLLLPPASRHISIASRLFTVAVSLVVLLSISRQITTIHFDWTLSLWAFAIAFHLLFISYYRPGDYATIIAYDLIIIVGMYLANPIPLRLQAPPALFLTLGSTILWLALKPLPWTPLENAATLSAYVVANFVGVVTSISKDRLRRELFVRLSEEKSLKEELEESMKEVKSLSGLLPICASCKSIRDDQGYWQAVEIYIRDRSEAEFSHGICDHCLRKEHPEVYNELLRKGKISGVKETRGKDGRSQPTGP
jgi:hypothetical protein